VALAIRRVLLLYALAFSYGGLPVIYMGDELGLRNDSTYLDDPARAADNRCMHRPPMDWEAAERRADPTTVEGRLWAGICRLVKARRSRPALHAAAAVELLWTGNEHVFAYVRRHAADALLALASFSAQPQAVPRGLLCHHGFDAGDRPSGPDDRPLRVHGDEVVLAPYQFAWLGRA